MVIDLMIRRNPKELKYHKIFYTLTIAYQLNFWVKVTEKSFNKS